MKPFAQDETALPSFEDYQKLGLYAEFDTEFRKPELAPFVMARIDQPAFAATDPPSSDFVIAMVTSGDCKARTDLSGTWQDIQVRSNIVALTPTNTACAWDIEEPHSLLVLAFGGHQHAELLRRIARKSVRDFGVLHEQVDIFPALSHYLPRMWSSSRSDVPDPLESESLFTHLLATCLHASGQMKRQDAYDEKLSGWQVKRVIALMQEHLSGTITLSNMAAAVGISEYHFLRAFRNTTGLPPHQYQLMMRINRAKRMIEKTKMSLPAVALSLGFSSQSHMTTAFGQWVGATPLAYRQAIKN